MKFVVKKVSDWKFNEEREINTVNDLKKLAEEHPGWHGEGESKDLIINFGWKEHPQPTITIYDDYIERANLRVIPGVGSGRCEQKKRGGRPD